MSQTMPLRLFNSLTRQIEPFVPVHPGVPGDPAQPPEARVYSCGPTVYNYPHIGNMRAYVFADVLGRTLSFAGYRLTHVVNITDVGHLTDDADAGEDKLEKAAAASAQSIWDIARHYTEAYWADIRALNIREPAQWSIATEYVPAMIEFGERIAAQHCYELDSGLYFDVSTVADYGRLARAHTEEGEGRIEAVDGKRNAADFAIWRKTPPGEKRQMEWDSPWGRGAPGWHLECSVMSGQLLGFPFDIHTGGIDHREIHHPNEIAQNQAFCCAGGPLRPGQFRRADLDAQQFPGRTQRQDEQVERRIPAAAAADRQGLPSAGLPHDVPASALPQRAGVQLGRAGRGVDAAQAAGDGGNKLARADRDDAAPGPKFASALERFAAAITDDLNTAVALTVLEEVVALKKVAAGEKLAAILAMDVVFGLDLATLARSDLRIRPKAATITEAEIEATLAARKQARADKDFARSDTLRDELAAQGVEVMDGDPLGWDWKLG